MSDHKNGAVDSDQTVKAGCGIRYDPDTLGADTGFDFSEAQDLLSKEEMAPIKKDRHADTSSSEADND